MNQTNTNENMEISYLHVEGLFPPRLRMINAVLSPQKNFLYVSRGLFGGWHIWFMEPKKVPIEPSPTINISSLLVKTSNPTEGFMSLKEIKEALGLRESMQKISFLLKAAKFQRYKLKNQRGWLVKIRQPTFV